MAHRKSEVIRKGSRKFIKKKKGGNLVTSLCQLLVLLYSALVLPSLMLSILEAT
ncbi:unnamed protein product [Ixodes persulcatus]